MPPMRIEKTISTMNPMPGSTVLRSHRLASTPMARTTAIQNRIVRAGSAECTSV